MNIIKDTSGQAGILKVIFIFVATVGFSLMIAGKIVSDIVNIFNTLDFPVSEATRATIATQVDIIFYLPIILVIVLIIYVIKEASYKRGEEL